MALVFGLSFLAMLFMVWALNFVINSHKPEEVDMWKGLHFGAFTGFFFSMMTMGVNYLYQRRSLTLWLIDGLYMVVGTGNRGYDPWSLEIT